jgi:dTDP-4-dehydrorhamnose 3,5-epimerase-like enzyme
MFDPNDYKELKVTESPIPGLFEVELAVFGDNRGWFKENYQAAKF